MSVKENITLIICLYAIQHDVQEMRQKVYLNETCGKRKEEKNSGWGGEAMNCVTFVIIEYNLIYMASFGGKIRRGRKTILRSFFFNRTQKCSQLGSFSLFLIFLLPDSLSTDGIMANTIVYMNEDFLDA